MAQGGNVFFATVPQMDFSWIPKTADDYRERKKEERLKETLADLDVDDPYSLTTTARKLLQSGDRPAMEMGLKIDAMARSREQMQRDLENEKAYQKGLTGQAPQAPQGPAVQGPYSMPSQGGPGPMVGASEPMARPEVMPSARVWGDREAEAAGLYEPRQQMAQAPTAPTAPLGAPGVAAPSGEEQRLLAERNHLLTNVMRYAKKPEQRETVKGLVAEKDRQLKELADRRGDTFKSGLQVGEEEQKLDVRERSKTFEFWNEQNRGAIRTDPLLGLLKKTLNDPNTITGATSEGFFKLTGSLVTINREAASLGLPHYTEKELSALTEPLKKAEAITSLSNQITQARIGTLGAGFSNADRDFTVNQGVSLGTSVAGNIARVEIHEAMNKRTKEIHKLINDYRRRPGPKSAPELEQKIAEYAASHPVFVDESGKPTALGEKVLKAQVADNPNMPGGGISGAAKRWLGGEAPVAPAAAAPARQGVPKAGEIIDGYRFKGGNPRDRNNWELAS